LSCTSSAAQKVATCTGVPTEKVTPCGAEVVEVNSMGTCSEADVAKIKGLPQGTGAGSIGAIGNACGTASYDFWTNTFSQETFNKCMASKVGISTACSGCYAEAGSYGAHNCKLACLTGWCTSSCLSCTSSAAQKVATCTGVPNEKVTPCSSQSERQVVV